MKRVLGKAVVTGWVAKRLGAAAAAVLAAGALFGCGEDLLNPGRETLIEGRVVVDISADPSQPPIFALGLGVAYHLGFAAGAPPLSVAQAGDVELGAPGPNPLTQPESDPLRIRASLSEATPLRVEIWSVSRDFSQAVAVLAQGPFEAGNYTWSWNGTVGGIGERLPNGLYLVRVTANPGENESVLERSVLLNRPVQNAIALDAFNTFSGPDGSFQILDIAVGETFTAADADGNVLGDRVLANRVTLFTDDADFVHREILVEIAPRNLVTVTVSLIPLAPSAPAFSLGVSDR